MNESGEMMKTETKFRSFPHIQELFQFIGVTTFGATTKVL